MTAPAALESVVLVHGGFVDGSGWEDVYKALRKAMTSRPRGGSWTRSPPR